MSRTRKPSKAQTQEDKREVIRTTHKLTGVGPTDSENGANTGVNMEDAATDDTTCSQLDIPEVTPQTSEEVL